MGHGSGGMASGMLMQNGRYSDERFIDAMVPHHQGAIAMGRVALQNAEHNEIRGLSENIISIQQAEIEEHKSIKQEEFGTHTDPFDRAFIDAMIPHHQSAIEMAQVASEKSNTPRIRELAANIIGAQQTEIEQMKQWRNEWYPKG